MSDGPIGVLLTVAGGLMVAGTGLAFNRAGFTRTKLGLWSAVGAVLSFLAGTLLVLYGLCHLLAPVSDPMADARVFLHHAFVHVAWAILLVMPMVLLEMPMNVLLAFRPILGLAALILVEIFFGASLLTHLAVPIVLILTFILLRVDWSRGRVRVRVVPEEERAAYRRGDSEMEPALPRHSYPPVFAQTDTLSSRFAHATTTTTTYGNRPELRPAGPATGAAGLAVGAYAMPVISIAAVAVTLAESILLLGHSICCDSVWLNCLLALFALTHGALTYATLGPSSTFA